MKHSNSEVLLSYRPLFLICMVSFVVSAPLIFTGCTDNKNLDPNELFVRYVMDPIPSSVENIKVDKIKRLYVFRFNINRDDVTRITASRPFDQVWNVKYNHLSKGRLDWEWDSRYGINIIVYHPDVYKEPEWFELELWENPEAYAFVKAGDLINTQIYDSTNNEDEEIQILIYNEEDNEAYFIRDKLYM